MLRTQQLLFEVCEAFMTFTAEVSTNEVKDVKKRRGRPRRYCDGFKFHSNTNTTVAFATTAWTAVESVSFTEAAEASVTVKKHFSVWFS